MAKSPTIQLVKKTLFYRIYIYGGNGRLMLTSEAYFNHASAKRAGKRLGTVTGFPFIDTTVPAKPVKVVKVPVKAVKQTKKKGSK